MRIPRTLLGIVLCLPAVLAATPLAWAQTAGNDRLFLGFIEDAAIVEQQWWEGQIEYADGDDPMPDLLLVRGIVAFQPYHDLNLEVGGRVACGDADAAAGVDDGSGATDLEAWGKYVWEGVGPRTDLAAGGLVVVPTGDDAAGLGTDAFAIGGFGALRYRFDRFVLNVRSGFRAYDDGMIFGTDIEGDTSIFVGGGVIYPRSDRVSLVAEASWETERFEGAGGDGRILGGINWRVTNRGRLRGALAAGFDDSAPDVQAIVGWAAQF